MYSGGAGGTELVISCPCQTVRLKGNKPSTRDLFRFASLLLRQQIAFVDDEMGTA